MDNVFDAFNIATAPGVGTAGRIARKGATVAAEAVTGAAGRVVAKDAAGAASKAPEAASGAARVVKREGWSPVEPADGRPLTREEYDRQRVERINELHPEKKQKFTFSNEIGNTRASDGDQGVPVGGTSVFNIWAAKNAPSGTTTHELRHVMDGANQRVVSGNVAALDPDRKKELIDYLKEAQKAGKIAADSRFTDEFEIAQAVLEAAFRDPVGLEKASSALFDITKPLVKKYQGLNQTYQEYLASRVNNVKSDPASEALKATVKANADSTPDLAKMMNDLGDTTRASEVIVQAKAASILKGSDPTGTVSDIVHQLPDFLRPDAVTRGSTTLSGPRAIELAQRLEKNSAGIANAITEAVKVGRAPEEVYTEALLKQSQAMKAEVLQNGNLQDAVLNVKRIMPSENPENVASVRVYIGQTDKSLFETRAEATQAAIQRYKLDPKTFRIRQEGTGYAISIEKHLDETTGEFRGKITTTANTVEPSMAGTFLGFLRSADDRVPKFQIGNRLATVHGRSRLESVFRDMRDTIGRMSQKHTDQVSDVMKLDRQEIPPGWTPKYPDEKPPRGYTRKTFGEFEEAFFGIHKEYPTEQQIAAYFTAKKLHEWDYITRNLGVYRDRARIGGETVTLRSNRFDETTKKSYEVSEEFVGKRIKELPYNSDRNADIVIHEAGKEPRRISLLGSTPEQKAEIEQFVKQGYQIIEVENPVRVPFKSEFGPDPVNFIVTKDVSVRPLDPVQIPWRDGWHSEYDYGWYVKQPVVREAGGKEVSPGVSAPVRNVYEGDKVLFGFETRAEAVKYATNMEKARKMFLANDKSLDDFVTGNLPYTPREFRRLFIHDGPGDNVPPPFDIRSPFLHVENGRTLSDDYGNFFTDYYKNFEDAIRSPHNKFASHIDKKFLGHRDDVPWTVREGEPGKPFMQLTEAAEVDPFISLQNSTRNIIRNRHFQDYKIAHTEGWINQFGHLLDAPLEDVRANPVWYIHHGTFSKTVGNADVIHAAENSRKALMELLGTPGKFDQAIDALKINYMDSLYESGGQAKVEGLMGKRNFLLHAEKDPVSFMRKTVFHTSIGMFNPYQMFQNAMTMAHAIAIGGPVHGFSGAAGALPMRYALINENALDRLSKMSVAWGYKPEWFKESFQELKRSGKYIVEGEHTWKDDIAEVSMRKTATSAVLDAGLIPFKEGERLARIAAWNIAFREFRSANPTKAITDDIRRELMARSDLMTANMTRASNAAWQQGPMAIPAQFMSYWTRLSEQMLGKRLTPAEKARIVGFNSLLYGVPIGVTGAAGLGALTGGQIPWHENIREAMLSRGYDPNNPAVELFNGGITNLVASYITGEQTDLAAKVGPGGGMFLKNMFFEDKKAIDILFGAAGQKGGSVWESLDPVMKWAASPFRADEQDYPLRIEDAVGIIRNVKAIDSSLAVIYAHNYGMAYAKNGQALGPMTTLQAVFQMATGGGPQKISDMYLQMDANKDRKELVRRVTEVASRDGDALMKAIIANDDAAIKAYQQRIAAHMHGANLLPAERAEVFRQMANKHKDKLNQVRYEYYIKNVPQNRVEDRQKVFMDQSTAQ